MKTDKTPNKYNNFVVYGESKPSILSNYKYFVPDRTTLIGPMQFIITLNYIKTKFSSNFDCNGKITSELFSQFVAPFVLSHHQLHFGVVNINKPRLQLT